VQSLRLFRPIDALAVSWLQALGGDSSSLWFRELGYIMSNTSTSPIIVALDYASAAQALNLVDHLTPSLCRLKVGKELFVAAGPAFVEKLVAKGFDVFLDLKFHDIPQTVANACRAAAELGVWMVNVHASGGTRMLYAAQEALLPLSHRPLLIAVTVLTSLEQTDLAEMGLDINPADHALRLAALAHQVGLAGVVCSAQEAQAMRQRFGHSFITVTPGIRLAEDARDDQRRVTTPQQAMQMGAHYLVMGRPITQAADPCRKLQSILEDLKNSRCTGQIERGSR
jgi:orotidine-5'-phosphate decarboxylase